MASLADRIKQLRLSANMTQEEFGQKFGIVKSTVSLYENGKSTPNDQIKKKIYVNTLKFLLITCWVPNILISLAMNLINIFLNKSNKSSIFIIRIRNESWNCCPLSQNYLPGIKLLSWVNALSWKMRIKAKNNTEQQYKEEGIKKAT